MAIYKFCDGTVLTSTTITLTQTDCVYDSEYTVNTYTHTIFKKTLTFTLSQAATVDLDVGYNFLETVVVGGVQTVFNGTLEDFIVIPAGETVFAISVMCEDRIVTPLGGMSNSIKTNTNHVLKEQWDVPTDCGTPPPPPITCTLAVTSTSKTDVTTYNGTDGTITVNISGATGATPNVSYSLNGVLITSAGSLSTYTFTGLAHGTYNIYITQGICYASADGIVINNATPPVACTLGLVSLNTTNPVLRGESTGTIAITLSGATGTTQNITYKLNGVTQTTAGSLTSYTYINLPAGTYSIYVQQQGCFFAVNNIIIQDGEFRTGDFTVFEPSDLTAVDNPINISVSTAINNPNAVVDIVRFEFDNNLNNNNSVTFNLTSPFIYSQTFYAKGYPNKPNYFLATTLTNASGVPVGTNTHEEIAVSFADALNNDALIPKIYNINNIGTTVTLSAKETGSRFNLTSSNVSISGTIGFIILQSGLNYCDGQISDNYSISCEVMANTDELNQYPDYGTLSDYNQVAELILPFNQVNNIHNFDISSILKSQVSTPRPDLTLTGSTMLPSVIQPFYVKLSELYPLVPNTNTIKKRFKTNTNVRWVINSSLDRFSANNMDEYLGDTYEPARQNNVKFLTNSPNPKQIQRNSNEFLYFILRKNYGATLTVKGDLYFYDGTQALNQTFFTVSTYLTNAGGCMVMNLSYDKLGLAAYEISGSTNRKIKRAEIAVYQNFGGGDIQYTQEKVYRFEIDEQPRKFGVLFQNALGMYDAFDFIGVVETTVNRTSDSFTIPLQFNTDGSLPQGFINQATYNTRIVNKITCNTGWIDGQHFDWLKEMLKSNNIYSTSTTNQNYLNLTDFTYRKSSLEDLFDCEITFLQTIYENNVTV